MRYKLCEPVLKNAAVLFLLMVLSSCGRESVFTAPVVMIPEPDEVVEVSVERIPIDHLYSEFFAVYDTLLISARPNNSDYGFYVSDIRSNKLLGSFMRHGQGPGEYTVLSPIKRIERKGEDLISLIYAPHKMQLIEWNITQSIKIGKDSLLLLGEYTNSNEYGFTYSEMYRIGNTKYIGYTPGYSFDVDSESLLPKYWILDGADVAPVRDISIVKGFIRNKQSVISENFFFTSAWSLSPDNSKIFDVMNWLKQVNIIDLNGNNVHSYRIAGSPDESIFDTNMENAVYQYHDVASDKDHIYALYSGESPSTFKDNMGYYWIHEFDWDGNFVKKYHLSVPIFLMWLDPATGILYGYSYDDEDAIYKINLPSRAES